MNYFRNLLARRTEDGASAVEYGLLVAAIAAVIVGVVFALGSLVHGTFTKTCTSISGNAAGQSLASGQSCN